ncbi:MAG: ABC transporter permease [Verrucomicrobia bacterium]|nr:ABC transporter permease [Verrucomicrobiota bacterium]MCH8510201.1 ABC transporter permease [Kiritimatiellia bacterium]
MITREPYYCPECTSMFARWGYKGLSFCQQVGQALLVALRAIVYIPLMFSKRNRHEVWYQLFFTGIKSLPVISVVALFTGMIFAVQTGIELARFGQEVQVGGAVTVVMLREMGPFMTGLIIAASVGSSISAQLGTMTVSEEIAALEIMSIDPIRFLVMPRMIALLVMMPLLTLYTDLLAVAGGAIIGVTQLGVEVQAYLDNAVLYAELKDLYTGLFKALCFGFIICAVACHEGFTTTGGAVGVGKATRSTVVISFLVILVTGFILTKMFYN